MLFALPDPDTLYKALVDRDASYEGRAYVAGTTTGVFCRLTCPARKPRRENCLFHDTVSACLEAGYRPCQRCRPIPSSDPVVTELLALLGHDPSTVRRAFRRSIGVTFLDLARQRRMAEGFGTLAAGDRVIDAQIDAGFDSPSAFREAFARILGIAPGALRKDARLQASWIDTPLGAMIAVADARALYLLEFLGRKALSSEMKALLADARGDIGLGNPAPLEHARRELDAYFTGRSPRFTVPLAPGGTAFETRVWAALRTIPAGETRSYADLARMIGQPTATRAVARANGRNRIALLIPCHRVIGADGSLTGYGGGLWRKERLIAIERNFRGEIEP